MTVNIILIPDSIISFVLFSTSLSILLVLLIAQFRSNGQQAGLNDPSLAWHNALEMLDDPIILTDSNDKLVHANKAFYFYINQEKENVIGQKVHLLLHSNDGYLECDACKSRIAKQDITFTRDVDNASNPFPFPVDIVIRAIKNNQGEAIGSLQTFHNITHIRNAEKALRESEYKLAEAQRIGQMGNWEWNITEDLFNWSEEMWRIFGCPKLGENNSGYQNFMAFIHAEDRSNVRNAIQAAIKNKNHCFLIDHRITLPDGENRDIRHQGKLSYSDDDNCVRLAGVTQDITTQKAVENALHEEKEKAQVTLQSIGDAVLTMDVNGIIDYVNPMAEELLMLSSSEMVGKHHNEVLFLIDESSFGPIENPVLRSLNGQSELFYEQIILVRPDKSQFSIAITSAPIIVQEKLVTGATLVIHDVTEMRSLAKQLSYQASHDELTGLVNRREFERKLNQAVDNACNKHQRHALLYMDLDQFKIVNDTCGHLAGDELLKQISDLLCSNIRDVDTLARLGGDEFAVLLDNCPSLVSEEVAETLRRSIEEFRFGWDGRVFKIGVSIGLVPITNASGSLMQILRNADAACYVAKNAGRNRIYLYKPDSRSLGLHQGEIKWVQKINNALENNHFVLFSQTIQSLKKNRHLHFEILLRMKNNDGDYVQPDTFIPAAERYQLMPSVDRWVIENTLLSLMQMKNRLMDQNYVCSINLSGQSLTDTSLLDFITQKLDETEVDPVNICFEITETTAIANLSDAGRFINVLRDMGIRFSLDDFGSGLSSFDYLKKLNIDYLKIDGSFIKDITSDPIDYAMVKSINQIGHLMGVETIAEFVESEEIMLVLNKLGIDYGQGYQIAKPVPLESFLEMNAAQSPLVSQQ